MDELWDYFRQHFAELHQEITELHRKVERLMSVQDDINNAKAAIDGAVAAVEAAAADLTAKAAAIETPADTSGLNTSVEAIQPALDQLSAAQAAVDALVPQPEPAPEG